MTEDLGRVRGAAFDEFLGFYGALHGQRLAQVVRSLPEPITDRVRWENGLPRAMPMSWYSGELLHGILDGISADMDEGQRDRLCRDVANHVMETTLKGLYKAAFKMVVSPSMMARFAPRMWKLYYDSGTSTVAIENPTQYCTTTVGWKSHHDLLCRINRHCGDWIYSSLGCDNVRSKRTACVGQGAAQCAVVTSWS